MRDSKFKTPSAQLSPATFEILIEKSKDRSLNASPGKLLAIALDNELEAPNPFYYPCEMPTSVYIENAYVDEASKLYTYLSKFGNRGLGKDYLMLHRRDAGIPDKITFMLAYRELLEQKMIEEHRPGFTNFEYSPSYRFTRCIGLNNNKMTPAQRRKMEKDALTARLKELEGEESDT